MKTSLLTDKETVKTTVLGSAKAEPKKLTALEQINKAVKMHLKGVYLF